MHLSLLRPAASRHDCLHSNTENPIRHIDRTKFSEKTDTPRQFDASSRGSSGILNLDLSGSSFWQIGAEGGMWDIPVLTRRLVLAPAERADVLVDFSRFAGARLTMMNHRPPSPVSNPAPQLPQVMQIRVGRTVTN